MVHLISDLQARLFEVALGTSRSLADDHGLLPQVEQGSALRSSRIWSVWVHRSMILLSGPEPIPEPSSYLCAVRCLCLRLSGPTPPHSPSGTSAAPRSIFSASSCWRACGDRSRLAVRASRAAENVRKTKTPSSGIAKSPAAREAALFTPEASPECLPSTELIAVVVSGAMTNDIPRPITTIAGKNVVQYEPSVPGMAKRIKPVAATS